MLRLNLQFRSLVQHAIRTTERERATRKRYREAHYTSVLPRTVNKLIDTYSLFEDEHELPAWVNDAIERDYCSPYREIQHTDTLDEWELEYAMRKWEQVTYRYLRQTATAKNERYILRDPWHKWTETQRNAHLKKGNAP